MSPYRQMARKPRDMYEVRSCHQYQQAVPPGFDGSMALQTSPRGTL